MPEQPKMMTAADEARAYLSVEPKPKWFNRDHVAQLLAEHDEQRDRAERAEADAAEARAYLADPFNRHRIAAAVQRAHRQRDEAVEAVNAEVEEYRVGLKAANSELARLRAELDEARAALAGWGEEWREHVYDHDLLDGGDDA